MLRLPISIFLPRCRATKASPWSVSEPVTLSVTRGRHWPWTFRGRCKFWLDGLLPTFQLRRGLPLRRWLSWRHMRGGRNRQQGICMLLKERSRRRGSGWLTTRHSKSKVSRRNSICTEICVSLRKAFDRRICEKVHQLRPY